MSLIMTTYRKVNNKFYRTKTANPYETDGGGVVEYHPTLHITHEISRKDYYIGRLMEYWRS